jgi:hypothetical protein
LEIVTKRFFLRDFIQEDEPSFFAYHADPRYAEFCAPEELTPSYTSELLILFHLAHRYGFIPIEKRISPDWMAARRCSQTEWQLTKKSWETIVTKLDSIYIVKKVKEQE